MNRFEVFSIPTKFGCWQLSFQLALAYTKFNGFQKPAVARSKIECYYLQKNKVPPPLEGDEGGGFLVGAFFYYSLTKLNLYLEWF